MRYQLTPISTRPWLLNGLSLRLIESHYEHHYGGALRRLNAITEQLDALDFDRTAGHFAVSHSRVAIPKIKQCSRHVHRQVQRVSH